MKTEKQDKGKRGFAQKKGLRNRNIKQKINEEHNEKKRGKDQL